MVARGQWPRAVAIGAAVAAMLVVVATSARILTSPSRVDRPVTRFAIPLPDSAAFTGLGQHVLAISPQGTRLVFVANNRLYLRLMNHLDESPIRGTNIDPIEPFFSPDGEWVGFWANGQIMKVPTTGGVPVVVCKASAPNGASWTDDTIVFAERGDGIFAVPAAGGTPVRVIGATAREEPHLPHLLPARRSILFTTAVIGHWDDTQIVVESLDTHQRTVVARGGTDAQYLESGHLVYGRDGVLHATTFDLGRLGIRGSPVALLEGLLRVTSPVGSAQFAISASGSLVYLRAAGSQRALVWVDREGHEESVGAPLQSYLYPRISPDGSRIAVHVGEQEQDIWVWEFARATLTQFTFGKGLKRLPLWMRDGRQIIYDSTEDGARNIYSKPADGTGAPTRLTTSLNQQRPDSVSPDGKVLVLWEMRPDTNSDLLIVTLDRQHESRPLLATTSAEDNGEISPDGQWLAYQSNESGRQEVYVRPFPNVDQGKWRVSSGGGSMPAWARDSQELFYVRADQRLMAATVDTRATFLVRHEQALIDMRPYLNNVPAREYDVSADGRQFLMTKSDAPDVARHIEVVENWIEELKQRVAAK
jgi:serine/threonine-protein kinase